MALVLSKICKTVAGEVHLADIDISLEPGSFNVVLGLTQAGKTSLLRVIAGLDRPTSGAIRLGDRDITKTSVRQRSVAMVYQQFINYPSLTVRENIASPLRMQKAANVAARVEELARTLRIQDLLDRLPGQLSGGQQQRVAIARALAKGADILLLDEPLVNLDYKLREGLREELRTVLKAQGCTVLYATTDPAEALALGGDTILMHEGRVLQHAPTLEVYHRPACVAAARVFSDPPMNIVTGTVREHEGRRHIEISAGLEIPMRGHLDVLNPGRYRFGIRASDCRLLRAGADAVAERIAQLVPVSAQVELSEISGSETFVYLRHGDARFIVQQDGVFHHELDQELTFYIDPDRLLAFANDGSEALVASYR